MDRVYYPANAAKRTFIKSETKKAAAQSKIRVTYSRTAKKEEMYLENFLSIKKLGEYELMSLQKSYL